MFDILALAEKRAALNASAARAIAGAFDSVTESSSPNPAYREDWTLLRSDNLVQKSTSIGIGLLDLPPATPEQAADEAADRAAIAAEPLLPDPGTPERELLDGQQTEMLAGLRATSGPNYRQ
jgi:hypothetical protein